MASMAFAGDKGWIEIVHPNDDDRVQLALIHIIDRYGTGALLKGISVTLLKECRRYASTDQRREELLSFLKALRAAHAKELRMIGQQTWESYKQRVRDHNGDSGGEVCEADELRTRLHELETTVGGYQRQAADLQEQLDRWTREEAQINERERRVRCKSRPR